MQNLETNKLDKVAALLTKAPELNSELGSGRLLGKAASIVDSVSARGQHDAESVAKSLGGELDEEIEFDLDTYRRQLAQARHELAVRLGIDVPVLVGDDEEGTGEVREVLDVAGAVAYLTGEHPDQEWIETEIHFLKEQGYDNAQVIEAYVLAGKGPELIVASPEMLDMPRHEFIDELACVPGGLELFQEHTSAGECISTDAFLRIIAEPGGVNRGFAHLKFFQDPHGCMEEGRDAIDREEHPDRLSILTALETFPSVLDDTILSALRRGETTESQMDDMRLSAESTAVGMIEQDDIPLALELLKAVGALDHARGSEIFAKRILNGQIPEQVAELAAFFPKIREVARSIATFQNDAENAVLRAIQGGWVSDATNQVIDVYGLTWDGLSKNVTVRRWMEYPHRAGIVHRELSALLELMKPPREQIMKAVNRAVRSTIDSPYGFVDVESYKAVLDTFGLSGPERETVRIEDVGVEMVKEKLAGQLPAIPTAERVIAASADSVSVRLRFQSKEMQDIAWSVFEDQLRMNQFDAAHELAFFGLDRAKMTERARDRYLEMLEDGEQKNATDQLDELFDIGKDDIPQSRIDAALRMGIDRCLRLPIGDLARYVYSYDISAGSADVNDLQRSTVDLRMKEDLAGYFGLSDPKRAKLNELFGVSPASLSYPDAEPHLERQVCDMIRNRKDVLVRLREAVPRIVERDWYRNEARKRVFDFVRHGANSENNDIRLFLANFEKLTGLPNWLFRSPEILVSVQETVHDLAEVGKFQSAVPFVEAFGVSVDQEARTRVEAGHTDALYLFGTLIDKKSVDAWKQGGVGSALEKMMKKDHLLGAKLVEFYTGSRNFDGLAMAIDLGIAPAPYPDESDAIRELQKLETNGNAIAAEGLLNCYGPLGSKLFDAGLRERIKRAAAEERSRRANRETVSLDKEQHSVERDLADFYLDEWIGFELSSLERKAVLNNIDLDFTSKMAAYNQKDVMRGNTESQFNWMREYLVRAVIRELGHQSQFSTPKESFVSLPGDKDAWISQATNEEIRQCMAAAQKRFVEPGWSSSYGGKPWAQIAAAAEMMFGIDPDKHKLVDLAYDLSHNNGTVFNKETDRIEMMATQKIAHVLSAKREVSDPEAYLALLEREVGPNTFAAAMRRWDEWKGIRAKLEREIDGAETDRRAGYVETVRERAAAAGDDFNQLSGRFNQMETGDLQNFISSTLLNAGRDGRSYLMSSAEQAISKRVGDFPGGVVGVLERLGRKGLVRNVELDVFGPLVATYLKTRADVARDQIELSLAGDIVRYRQGGKPVDKNQMTPDKIPEEIQEIIDAIIKE